MTIQYIDFSTKPDYATIWDTKDGAPVDAVAVNVEDLRRFVEGLIPMPVAVEDFTQDLVNKIDTATKTAYMYDTFTREEWHEAIRGLLIIGLDPMEVQAVLRSKIPRWSDNDGPHHRDVVQQFRDHFRGRSIREIHNALRLWMDSSDGIEVIVP